MSDSKNMWEKVRKIENQIREKEKAYEATHGKECREQVLRHLESNGFNHEDTERHFLENLNDATHPQSLPCDGTRKKAALLYKIARAGITKR